MSIQIILALVGYFVFAAAAGAMAPPTDAQARSWYGWFYRFIQRLAANADRLAEAKFRGITAGAVPDASIGAVFPAELGNASRGVGGTLTATTTERTVSVGVSPTDK